MKRSARVPLSILTTVASAALAAGCGSKPAPQQADQGWQTCVDRNQNTAVEQRYCDEEQGRVSQPGYVPHYGWYYYPRGPLFSAPGLGMPVPVGGSWGARPMDAVPVAHGGSAPTSAGSSSTVGRGNPSTTTRGGFGSTASGHASGGA